MLFAQLLLGIVDATYYNTYNYKFHATLSVGIFYITM